MNNNSKKFLNNFKNRLEKKYNSLSANFRNTKTTINLYNQNFSNGSIIIDNDWFIMADEGKTRKIEGSTNGYVFKLQENIWFNPNNIKKIAKDINNPTGNEIARAGRVDESQHDFYNPRAFNRFFAHNYSSSNVTLDLNGFKIEQSFEHSIQQRFFSIIELALPTYT